MRRICLMLVLFSVVAALSLTGCVTSPQPTQSPLTQPNAAPTTSPLPTPTTEAQPLVLKVDKAGTATVGGRLLRLNNTPIKNTTVYVAPIETSTGSKLASIDPAIALHVETDTNGQFVFTN